MIGLMDKGGSGQAQPIPPQIQNGMNNLPPDFIAQLQAQQSMNNLPADVVAKLKAAPPPKPVDPLSYSDPTNMPDPMLEAMKYVLGTLGYGPNAKGSKP